MNAQCGAQWSVLLRNIDGDTKHTIHIMTFLQLIFHIGIAYHNQWDIMWCQSIKSKSTGILFFWFEQWMWWICKCPDEKEIFTESIYNN